jgi:caspase domain-containing protein
MDGLNQPLPGCLNDMSGWRDYLVSALDLKPAGVRLLSDSRAIRSAILERLYWLLADAEAGDQRFFVFAGHGACPRRRNPATGALQDRLDETLVAYPDDRDDYEDFMIFDEDLAALVDSSEFPPTANLTFIFDSCNSGLRDLVTFSSKTLPPSPPRQHRCGHAAFTPAACGTPQMDLMPARARFVVTTIDKG